MRRSNDSMRGRPSVLMIRMNPLRSGAKPTCGLAGDPSAS